MAINITGELLRKLVSYKTVTGDFEANNAALDYISDYLSDRGMHINRFEFENFGSLVATTKPNTKTPTVMLYAHIDVVPGGDIQWEVQESNGKYYGRGVFDMKFSLASYMQIVEELRGDLGDYDFGIMVTTDEETGGTRGTERLISIGYLPKICVMPDGGEGWEIETRAKGIWHLQLETKGKSSHGSRPWEGDNAITSMMKVIHEIEDVFSDGQKPHTDTLTVSYINAGKAINQVPDHAEAGLDIRFVSNESRDLIKRNVVAICSKHNVATTLLEDGAIVITDLTDPYVESFMQSIKKITGLKPKPCISHGSTDARFFAEVNISSIISTPVCGDRHGNNEWIDVEGVKQFTAVVHDYIEKVAKKKSTKAELPLELVS